MNDLLCPTLKILQISGEDSEYKPSFLELKQKIKLQKFDTDIDRIVYDLDEKIYLRLLTCKDAEEKECDYNGNRNKTQTIKKICEESFQFSYIYYNIINSHYLAVFIPSLCIDRYTENTQEIINVISWLNLQEEKITFEIFHYGKPLNQHVSSSITSEFSNVIKNSVNHKLYRPEEKICFMTYLEPVCTVLKFPKNRQGRIIPS